MPIGAIPRRLHAATHSLRLAASISTSAFAPVLLRYVTVKSIVVLFLCLLSFVFCPSVLGQRTKDKRQRLVQQQKRPARTCGRAVLVGAAFHRRPPVTRHARPQPPYFCFRRRPRMPAPTRSSRPEVGSGAPPGSLPPENDVSDEAVIAVETVLVMPCGLGVKASSGS